MANTILDKWQDQKSLVTSMNDKDIVRWAEMQ